MPTTINVLLLTETDCNAVHACNSGKPRGPLMIICDHGQGCCISWDDVHKPLYQEWYDALDAIDPFTNRSATEIELPDDI